MEQELYSLPLREFLQKYPMANDFLANYGLHTLNRELPFPDAVAAVSSSSVMEMGLSPLDLSDLLLTLVSRESLNGMEQIEQVDISGGSDKDGVSEKNTLCAHIGEVISLVGPTGSGKSQLLADIECAARGDTPSGRHVRFNGKELEDELRFSLGNHLVAQLTQNMNYVIDVSVEDFMRMHANSRHLSEADLAVKRCFEIANELSGEPFDRQTHVTRLSGGQARAMMIADAVCITPSPILLIDEIENAGIDRVKAIELLTGSDKIVLLATHDPLLALSASRRVILRNGGITAVLEKDEKECELLRVLIEENRKNSDLRLALRAGERMKLICGNSIID